MTEEIIEVNGLNVTECTHLSDCLLCDYTENHSQFCSDYDNCYYKQLKRAEIEIEKLKGVDGSVHPDSVYYKITRLEQENKDLKDNNNHLQAIIDDGRAENKRFREENKEQAKELIELRKEFVRAAAFTEKGKPLRECLNAYKYKDALEEIRELLGYGYIVDKINEVLGND